MFSNCCVVVAYDLIFYCVSCTCNITFISNQPKDINLKSNVYDFDRLTRKCFIYICSQARDLMFMTMVENCKRDIFIIVECQF